MPRRNPRPIVQLATNLAKILLPLVVITVVAWWILNRETMPQGQLRVTSTVKGADIYVDGVQTGALTDTLLMDVEIGRRLVTVRSPGLVSSPEVAIVEVQRDRISVASFVMSDSARAAKHDLVPVRDGVRQDAFQLDEEMIRSIPPAPQRRTMLEYQGITDTDITDFNDVRSSHEEIRPRGENQAAPEREVISDEARRSLSGTQISVTSVPPGAQIVVNGARTTNRTPYTFRGLDRGYYVFSLLLDGHVATPESIEVALSQDGQNELAAFSLKPVNQLPIPQLSIQTKPLAAGIRLDGVAIGVGNANVNTEYGVRVIEFANVPGFKTPDPVRITISQDDPNQEVTGTYERLSGSAMIAVVPNENFIKFDGSKLRIYVDGELILDGPKDKFDATLLGSLYAGERAVKIQYDDLETEDIVMLIDDQVAELTIRIDAMFSKRKLKFKAKTDIPLDRWQERFKKSNILTQS